MKTSKEDINGVQRDVGGGKFTRFIVADVEGTTSEVTTASYCTCPVLGSSDPRYRRLRQFVTNEIGQKAATPDQAPKHIEYMRQQELVNYCDVSERGHYKWYPKGLLIQRLILDYAAALAREWGAFEMRNPLLIRGNHNVIGELMGEFHERDYVVDGGRGTCYLRYASDPLAFPFMQDVLFSHKQAPLKVFEEALCFRNEQEGEVSGLKRVRAFTMTDMHAACSSEAQAHAEFEWLTLKFGSLMDRVIAQGRWVIGWEGTIEFYEQNKAWLVALGTQMGVPAFFKLMPEMSHYYAMKNEFQFITEDNANIQVSTVQWDVKDGPRFNIGYTNEVGQKVPCPVILHASSFGSIERTLCALLESIAHDEAAGRPPMFPFWLSPTQVRIVPVSDKFLAAAEELVASMDVKNIRADVDDRGGTVNRKIRDAEQEWIPCIVVLGEREVTSGLLAVRFRDSGQATMDMETLLSTLAQKQNGMPFRGRALGPRLSQRPTFFG